MRLFSSTCKKATDSFSATWRKQSFKFGQKEPLDDLSLSSRFFMKGFLSIPSWTWTKLNHTIINYVSWEIQIGVWPIIKYKLDNWLIDQIYSFKGIHILIAFLM